MGNSIIMTGGGGGIDPDECTAGRPQVLSGYIAGVHGEDDPAPGSMPERAAWTGSVGMNGSITIPDGHHNGAGKVTGPTVTQRGAWNGSVGMNSSVTVPEGYHNGGGKVSGPSVSYQNADVSGTDRAYATGTSAWGGVMCLGVRNGHYLNGVNWIQADIPGLQAANIKENVIIGNLKGTMKDYSYLAQGQTSFNGASFSGVLGEGAEICYVDPYNNIHRDVPELNGNGLRMYTSTATNVYPQFCPKKSINMSPFRQIRVTGMYTGNSNGKGSLKVEIWNTNVDKNMLLRNQAMGWLAYQSASLTSGSVEATCIVDVSGISGQTFLTIMFSNSAYKAWPDYYIKRIEFLT